MSVTTAQNPYLGAQAVADTFSLRGAKAYGKILFVDGFDGSDLNTGLSWDTAFKTMAVALAAATNGSTIYLAGRVQEQITAPQDLFDVSIIGTPNRPRHGTADGVQQGNPAQWSPLATGTATPNLTLREQGYVIENVLFDAPDAAACVKLSRGEIAANMDASHATFRNCRFVSGGTGIEDAGGHFNVLVEKCVFQALTNGIKCTSTGIAIPSNWQILDNEFMGNTSDIIISLNDSTIRGNMHHMALPIVNTAYNSAQGARNAVVFNFYADSVSNYKGTVVGSATDIWVNYGTDALGFGHS